MNHFNITHILHYHNLTNIPSFQHQKTIWHPFLLRPPYSCFHIKKHNPPPAYFRSPISIKTPVINRPMSGHSPQTMNSTPQQQIPIHYTPDDRHNRPLVNQGPQGPQLTRRHTARYYVHRVKESLTTRISKLICSVFLSLLFIVGLITFILWLSLRPHRPRFHIQQFSIPSLPQDNGFVSAQVTYNVTARNPNLNIGIYYDTVHVTLYYQNQNIGEGPLVDRFYQEPKNTTDVVATGTPLVVDGAVWGQFVADRMRGEVKFRLEVASVIKFKVAGWESKRHKMHANCDIGVGPDGLLIARYSVPKCPVYFT